MDLDFDRVGQAVMAVLPHLLYSDSRVGKREVSLAAIQYRLLLDGHISYCPYTG